MKKVLLIYLGSRGGGVLDTWETFEGLKRNNPQRYSVMITRQNPYIEKYKNLAPDDLYIVKTHERSFSSAIIHTFLLIRPILIIRKILKVKPSAVFFTMEHSWMPFIVMWLRIFNKSVKIIYTKHNPMQFDSMGSGIFNKILHNIDMFLFKKAHHIFTLSEYVKNELLKIPGVNRDNFHTFPLGIHYSLSNKKEHEPFFKDGILRILFFGRILSYKGLDVLAQSFEIMKNENLPVELIVAGEGNIPTETLNRLNHANANIINSWIDDDHLMEMLAATDVVIVPYTHASQSGPVGIAIAQCIPVIASNVGGLPEQIKNEINGFIVKASDSVEIVDAVKKILNDSSLLNKFSSGAKYLCENEFSRNNITKKIDITFDKILL